MAIDPIKLTENIRQSYIRYLTSTFRLRDENLRKLFHEEVERFWFTNGPILEATPPFKKGCYLQELIEEGVLTRSLEKFIYDALPYLQDNPLYLHQEKSLRKILQGRNVVIASGTSSGKTECFLIPILNYLLKEYEEGKLTPGVRALLLYPMNALANDQLRRLREISEIIEQKMPEFKITFGRYVGDTPETKKQGEEKFRLTHPGEELVKSELLSREEMRKNPPHILITNYAMLEYLLLRPKDSSFFDGEYAKNWKFLILDEAHIYSGATGIEMAMLIRRLKDRICENMKGDRQCIATSATLVKEEGDFDKVAKFATNLFGEKFEWNPQDNERQDLIKGERVKTTEKGSFILPLEVYPELEKIIQENSSSLLNKLFSLCKEKGIPKDILNKAKNSSDNNAKKFLYGILSSDRRVINLKTLVEDGAKNLQECIKKLVGNDNPSDREYTQIISLINILVWARPDSESLPLLPARYHLFVRAPEGIFVSFYPEPKIFLERRELTEEGYPVFELASCRRCGQEYLVGNVKDDKLKHSFVELDTPRKNRYFMLWEAIETKEDEDQEVAVPEKIAEKGKIWKLCVKCGAIWDDNPTCTCTKERNSVKTLIEIIPKDTILNKCYLCGLRSVNIVREFIFQRDAPAAVLTTALYQNIQKEHVKEKKILIFSDSRQDAAFFAPYLDFTYNRILFRRLIIEALKKNNSVNDYRVKSLCENVLKLAEENKVFTPAMDPKEKKKEIWKWILQDFCGVWDRRNSLEGVGLLSFEPIFPDNWSPIEEILNSPWNLTVDEVKAVYQILLNTMRFNIAITFPEDAPAPDDEFFRPRNREYKFRGRSSDKGRGIYSFIPAQGRLNARLEYLQKLYEKVTGKNDDNNKCRRLLEKIWEDLRDNWIEKGICSFSNTKDGVLYQLDYRYWRVIQENSTSLWYICNKCGTISPVSVRGVCSTFNCNGNLKLMESKERKYIQNNHYRHLYTNLLPIRMNSHEHTAQLTTDYASNIQQKFIRGKINVLSCSTTFELGVDLGELESIFLRNVPPEPSNYIQRAGRAGRRLNTIGFALTFAQLRSHDLTYFKEPWKMVDGRIAPPVVEIRNEKIISRHLYSVVLANFFRKFPEYFGSVDSFFRLDGGIPGIKKIKKYFEQKPQSIIESLKRVIPQNLHDIFDVENWGWIDNLIGSNGSLIVADEKIRDEYDSLKQFYNEKKKELEKIIGDPKKFQLNGKKLSLDMQWATDRMKTVREKQLIDFLATHTVIPKYGFPVDVVDLSILSHVSAAKNIKLERDLRIAISEFAPSAQVVANGYIWEISGLRVVKNKTWPIYWYAICPQCKRFHIQMGTTEESPPSISCKIHGPILRKEIHRFIVPVFGFITSKDYEPKKPGESRPKHEFTTRPYFFDYKGPVERKFSIGKFKIKCRYSSEGELAVVCKGKKGAGFWVCFTCGAAFSERQKGKHKTPYGMECSAPLRGPLHLGYTFKTDVLSISFEESKARKYNEYGESFWYSLLYAILEGASQAMGIKRQDIDGCLYPSEKGMMLILFDNVPGGAGLVKRVVDNKENFSNVLKSSLARVKNCTCGKETSCYGCLRNYQNQFCHEFLRRDVVLEFLESNL